MTLRIPPGCKFLGDTPPCRFLESCTVEAPLGGKRCKWRTSIVGRASGELRRELKMLKRKEEHLAVRGLGPLLAETNMPVYASEDAMWDDMDYGPATTYQELRTTGGKYVIVW